MSKDPPELPAAEVYTHEPMVNWLGVRELLRTGIRTAVAGAVGGMADAREIRAGLYPPADNPPLDMRAADTLWIDYTADTGDGWHSTYSVMWTLAQTRVTVAGSELSLPRAGLLVLGGDQVYPTPAENMYRRRLLGPMRAAFPFDTDDKVPPALVAIPGNHDWYDGLRGFFALFCRQQHIGNWRTQQKTSYFAVRLPHRWWLWGLDLQLGSEMDGPQLDYFRKLLEDKDGVKPGDRVILCTPEPSWIDEGARQKRIHDDSMVYSKCVSEQVGLQRKVVRGVARKLQVMERQAPPFRSLHQIERALQEHGVHLAATIAGDKHHYAHYAGGQDGPAKHRITCGGGGAYLAGTHDLPEELDVEASTARRGEQVYRLQRTYPSKDLSRQLRNRAVWLFQKNPAFCGFLAVLYLMYVWLLQSASKVPNARLENLTLTEHLAKFSTSFKSLFCELPEAVYAVLAHSPASVLFTLAVVAGAGLFTMGGAKVRRKFAFLGGCVHGLTHLFLALILLWGIGQYNLGVVAKHFRIPAEQFLDHPLQVVLFALETLLIGGVIGGLIFGVWMTLSNRLFGWHSEEVFSAQRIADFKSFLRIRIDASGATIYPLRIDKVCTKWGVGSGVDIEFEGAGRGYRLQPQPGPPKGPRFDPEEPILVGLIEDPIHLPAPPEAPRETS